MRIRLVPGGPGAGLIDNGFSVSWPDRELRFTGAHESLRSVESGLDPGGDAIETQSQ